ncbi:transporter [Geosmithia morbida]|uniref:Transporter n=1 Tax=Geosmithia morbida TaxID=1094350 RepID=A0A9P4YW65_9HYPO|nr:transporter [Geosmithia morbida]KAF4122831.1 transporter [Geosmithia morbida]
MKFRGGWLGTKTAAERDGAAVTSGIDATTQPVAAAEGGVVTYGDEKSPSGHPKTGEHASDSDAESERSLQYGVQVAEATLQVWSRNHLIAAYILAIVDANSLASPACSIWCVNFIQAFTSGVSSTLAVYVTSSFAAHSLTATTSIVSSLLAGLIKLPYAKVLDIFGRPIGFLFSFSCLTLGLIMMAACKNVYTYAAAQCFYSVGYNCIDFTITIFIADTSKLRNRAWWIAYSSSPWLITTWVYGPACDSMLKGMGWRWGLGIWAIIFPVVCAPLWVLLYWNQRKAEKAGLVHVPAHGRGILANVYYYLVEFDVVGILLLAAGLALFLLSFSIEPNMGHGWDSPIIICFLVFGPLLVVAFVLWELYAAPVTFFPWYLLKNRTILFTYTMVGSLYMPWYIWDSYFYSLNIVVFNQSVTNATYINNIYTIGSTVCALMMGIVLRYYGRLKWLAVFFGVPLTILGVSLMIHFRHPNMEVSYIVMCQIFVAFGGGCLVICEQMTVMAVSKHQGITAGLAVEGLVASVAGSIGSAIAGAMWQNLFPKYLLQNLPQSSQADFATIYGDITVQSSYPVGSPTRDAINKSYGQAQKLMLITATCLYSITWGSTLMWEDIDVKSMKPRAGLVMM